MALLVGLWHVICFRGGKIRQAITEAWHADNTDDSDVSGWS